jgi:hypothetical protein
VTIIAIPARFNGPPGSGNGGYTCGLIAATIGEGAEVTLRKPPPLDTPLTVSIVDGVTLVHHGNLLIAEGRVIDWELEVPPPPTIDQATEAVTRYVGFERHEFPTCFTCGPDRADGLGIWPGKVEGTDLVASPWAAPADVATVGDNLATEIVWAALDCPGAWVGARDITVDPVVLGRMAARVVKPLPVHGAFISYAWSLGEDGRKSYAGTAVADESGQVLAYARQTWIRVA